MKIKELWAVLDGEGYVVTKATYSGSTKMVYTSRGRAAAKLTELQLRNTWEDTSDYRIEKIWEHNGGDQ